MNIEQAANIVQNVLATSGQAVYRSAGKTAIQFKTQEPDGAGPVEVIVTGIPNVEQPDGPDVGVLVMLIKPMRNADGAGFDASMHCSYAPGLPDRKVEGTTWHLVPTSTVNLAARIDIALWRMNRYLGSIPRVLRERGAQDAEHTETITVQHPPEYDWLKPEVSVTTPATAFEGVYQEFSDQVTDAQDRIDPVVRELFDAAAMLQRTGTRRVVN